MASSEITQLVTEIREEYHIPPFFSDNELTRMTNQALYYFERLDEDLDVEEDLIARGLVKNYVFYAYNNRLNEFHTDYGNSIIEWQMTKFEVITDDNA